MGGGSVPAPPDPNASATAGLVQDTANYPFESIINNLAQTGGSANIGGTNYDFTGLGNAASSAAASSQTAQALLDIQKNYGSQYIQQRLADLQQSDPAGYAARSQLFNSILQYSQQNPDRPLATDLQNQITQTVQNSGKLDPQAVQGVQQGVRSGQAASGVILGNAPAGNEATALVGATDTQEAQAQAEGQSYLASGVSPQDVEYRRIQQSLGNLGAFVNNTTPEAEFGSVSSAGAGAAPYNPVNYSGTAAPGESGAATGLNFANTTYAQQSGYANQQANPWLSGLTTGVNGLGAAAKLGLNFSSAGQGPSAPNFGLAESDPMLAPTGDSFNYGSPPMISSDLGGG